MYVAGQESLRTDRTSACKRRIQTTHSSNGILTYNRFRQIFGMMNREAKLAVWGSSMDLNMAEQIGISPCKANNVIPTEKGLKIFDKKMIYKDKIKVRLGDFMKLNFFLALLIFFYIFIIKFLEIK